MVILSEWCHSAANYPSVAATICWCCSLSFSYWCMGRHMLVSVCSLHHFYSQVSLCWLFAVQGLGSLIGNFALNRLNGLWFVWKYMNTIALRLALIPIYIDCAQSPWYPLDRRLSVPQSRSGRRGEEKILDLTGTRTPTPLSSSP
jgi:hypothetical protein